MKQKHIIIFSTIPSSETAEAIANYLVNEKLAACCNILPGITSIYYWQDKIECDKELLLMIKTIEENYKQIENIIKDKHPYKVPEIISFNIKQGLPEYLNWITQTIKENYEQ
ncbi:MAG: divalent-cation tolerance protein CutA [Calditrichales bacterium]|nr:divalent-cation tolerance protein CutA [Calditrichales bacterium]